MTHWEEPPRARHYVAKSLSKNNNVVYVGANKLGMPSIKEAQIHENLKVLTPYFPIDNRARYRLPVINELYQYWLFRKIARKYRDYRVINFDFTATRIFEFFHDVIYYCNDSFSMISKVLNNPAIAKYHQWCEARVTAKSKFCVGISGLIVDELQRYNSNIIEIPLGSPDIDEFNIKMNESPSNNKTISVGLMAVVKNLNISSEVINSILDDDSINLSVIGPIENGYMNQIQKKDKITILGPLYGRNLYDKLNEFDVTIAPYSTSKAKEIFTGTGSKIYHYLSMGKPVVISYMAGLNQLNIQDKLIYIADKEEDFRRLIHKAHDENSHELIMQRIAFAKNNTWNKRMEQLIDFYLQMDSVS